MILLTYEELDLAALKCVRNNDAYPSIIEKRDAVAKAQLRKVVKEIRGMLDSGYPPHEIIGILLEECE